MKKIIIFCKKCLETLFTVVALIFYVFIVNNNKPDLTSDEITEITKTFWTYFVLIVLSVFILTFISPGLPILLDIKIFDITISILLLSISIISYWKIKEVILISRVCFYLGLLILIFYKFAPTIG
jgi:uncharacterized membrane protein